MGILLLVKEAILTLLLKVEIPVTVSAAPTTRVLPSKVKLASSSMVLPAPTIGILFSVNELISTLSENVDIPVTERLPIPALPARCKSLHSLEDEPRSNDDVALGMMLELTSALNTILSASVEPRLMLSPLVPPANVTSPTK